MSQTIRVGNLPARATEKDVRDFFNARIGGGRVESEIVSVVGPLCRYAGSNGLRSTVTFYHYSLAAAALKLRHRDLDFYATQGGQERIDIDDNFHNLTTVSAALDPSTRRPTIDIVVLHGLRGHAWESFASRQELSPRCIQEVNWLRDILPKYLKDKGIHARVMLYGYNAKVWAKGGVNGINEPVDNLINDLNTERAGDRTRPLFFIAHSLGGIVVKQVINTMKPPLIDAVGGCLFLAVPHRGSKLATSLGQILDILNIVLAPSKKFQTAKVKDLEEKSRELAEIAGKFAPTRHLNNIAVISCHETLETSPYGVIVDKDAAVLDYDGHPPYFSVNSNHRDIAKFATRDEHGLTSIMFAFTEVISEVLSGKIKTNGHSTVAGGPSGGGEMRPQHFIQQMPPSNPGVEDPYFALSRFDTVFLVDDSSSMAPPYTTPPFMQENSSWPPPPNHWEHVSKVLQECASRALRYDKDGIDIHFLNNTGSDRNNIIYPEQIESLFMSVEANGDTPLYDRLREHLTEYIDRFKANKKIPHYNLIIITDGEPSDGDYEDIENIVVECANDLKGMRASLTQLGIQFCQIGDSKDATQFFNHLDNTIKGDRKLDRDMVDTTRFSHYKTSDPEKAEELYQKILLGAIVRKFDKKELTNSPPGPNPVSLPMRSSTNPKELWAQ